MELVNKQNLTSLEVLEQINIFRSQEGNKSELRHDNLLTIIREEFEEEISLLKIQESEYKNTRGKMFPMFNLTFNQAKQILMRESKFVRKAMIEYIDRLENQLNVKQVPTTYLEALKEIIKIEEEKVALQSKVAILTHVNKLYTSTEIAKELGMKSATELNRKLAELKVQYKVNNTWVLTAKYSNLGYESIKQTVLDTGKVIYDRKFSQLGRNFVLELLGGNVCSV